ncbi:glutamate synthase [Bacillus manliponensis]|uniref:glutamate synthase n=1 Tax=Bacillus manliponensis TaxID=574376 RepID=UPI003518DE4F
MRNKAIVIGGSIAGKLAAKALSDFFKEVVILEAGEQRKEESARKQVPQSNHIHVLLATGAEELEKLFPNIKNELIELGSITSNVTQDIKWYHFGELKHRFKGDINIIQQSRLMLEQHIQYRTEAISNIIIQNGKVVEKLILDNQRIKVCGITVKCLETGIQENMYADLVVDASGFHSKNISWLQEHKINVKEAKVKIDLSYSTRMFRLKENYCIDGKVIYVTPKLPEIPYGAIIQKLEKNKYFLTYIGYANERLPQNEEGFYDFSKKIALPDILEFLQNAEAISDISMYKVPYQVRKQFEKTKNVPAGFLVIGDAHTRFDPIYGQGMTIAAMEAMELRRCLQQLNKIDKKFTQIFYASIAKIVDIPWEMTTTEIFRHPELRGDLSVKQKIQQWYTKKVYEVAATNEEVYSRLAKVIHLLSDNSHR